MLPEIINTLVIIFLMIMKLSCVFLQVLRHFNYIELEVGCFLWNNCLLIRQSLCLFTLREVQTTYQQAFLTEGDTLKFTFNFYSCAILSVVFHIYWGTVVWLIWYLFHLFSPYWLLDLTLGKLPPSHPESMGLAWKMYSHSRPANENLSFPGHVTGRGWVYLSQERSTKALAN